MVGCFFLRLAFPLRLSRAITGSSLLSIDPGRRPSLRVFVLRSWFSDDGDLGAPSVLRVSPRLRARFLAFPIPCDVGDVARSRRWAPSPWPPTRIPKGLIAVIPAPSQIGVGFTGIM